MNSLLRQFVALAAVLALAGCAAYKPVPDGYVGPIAVVRDSGASETGSKARLFALMTIDGNRIHDSFSDTAKASHDKGFSVVTKVVSRQVPARPMQVLIKGSHTTGAPIHEIFSRSAGTFFSVEGIVSFTPVADGEYVVKGELKKEGSSVWIEDVRTGRPVTQIVNGK